MTLEGEMQALQAQLRRQKQWEALDIHKLIQSVFQTPDGAVLLAILCQLANPTDHTFRPDVREASHDAGRREVMALLWRHGAASNSVPDITPNTHEQES